MTVLVKSYYLKIFIQTSSFRQKIIIFKNDSFRQSYFLKIFIETSSFRQKIIILNNDSFRQILLFQNIYSNFPHIFKVREDWSAIRRTTTYRGLTINMGGHWGRDPGIWPTPVKK